MSTCVVTQLSHSGVLCLFLDTQATQVSNCFVIVFPRGSVLTLQEIWAELLHKEEEAS